MNFNTKYIRELIKRLQRLRRSDKRDRLIGRLEDLMFVDENNGADTKVLGEAEDYLGMN